MVDEEDECTIWGSDLTNIVSAVTEDVGINIDGGELGLEIGRRFEGCIEKITKKIWFLSNIQEQEDKFIHGK